MSTPVNSADARFRDATLVQEQQSAPGLYPSVDRTVTYADR